MKPINKVYKAKERLLFLLNNIGELENFPFSKYIPDNAKKVEIVCKENNGERILEIDYILDIHSKQIQEVK
jgi:hypothetical protein